VKSIVDSNYLNKVDKRLSFAEDLFMKRLHLTRLAIFLSFLVLTDSWGDINSAKMTSTTQSSAEIQGMTPLEKPQQKSTPPITPLPPPVKLPPLVPQHAEYLHPGILVYLNGKWEGSDHLLNLPNNIGVYVTIVKPEGDTLDISQLQLQKEVEAIFEQANIRPLTLAYEGRPPLPAFEIEIFLYPIEKGYAASCEGRLFESVSLDRFKMDPNMAFQAITWEKQALIVGPKTGFAAQLTKTIQEIAGAFIERFQAYERMKKEIYH
jgi:hypothetical protein